MKEQYQSYFQWKHYRHKRNDKSQKKKCFLVEEEVYLVRINSSVILKRTAVPKYLKLEVPKVSDVREERSQYQTNHSITLH